MKWLASSVVFVIGLVFAFLALTLLLQPFEPKTSDSAAISIERCFKLGGVPVLDGWTGNPTACVFPPHPKESSR